MSDRERTIATLLRELEGRVGAALLRSSLERAYDAGAAATALELGKRTGPAIAEIMAERDRLRAEVERMAEQFLRSEHNWDAARGRIVELERALRELVAADYEDDGLPDPHTRRDEALARARDALAGKDQVTCPNALLPDGEVCPRCGGPRAPSGVDGGSWVHVKAREQG